MIFYSLTEGDIYAKKLNYRVKTCFIMTQLGSPLPKNVINIRRSLEKYLRPRKIDIIDANSVITGKDFLNKIWDIILSVPLGIAIITEEMDSSTMSNMFYEIGLMQAVGKETLIIKTKESKVPSDFVRTEYIEYDRKFKIKINKFVDKLFGQAEHYGIIADELKQNPLLAIDYLRRAYLITADKKYKNSAQYIFNKSTFDKQSENSIKCFLTSKD